MQPLSCRGGHRRQRWRHGACCARRTPVFTGDGERRQTNRKWAPQTQAPCHGGAKKAPVGAEGGAGAEGDGAYCAFGFLDLSPAPAPKALQAQKAAAPTAPCVCLATCCLGAGAGAEGVTGAECAAPTAPCIDWRRVV